jgi:hypothetical protein
MTAKDMIRFRDSVAADVSEQYPQLDYLDVVVARAIEKRAEILGWVWTVEGPKHKQGGAV